MRHVVLVALSLALAACGREGEVESGQCTAAIVLHGKGYLGAQLDGPRPPAGRPVKDGVQPGCNDGGPLEEGREVGLREVSGLPSEVAVYVEGQPDAIYVSEGYAVFLPMPGFRRRASGARCRVAGTVTELNALRVDRRAVHVDGRTRFEGFPGSLPYLRKGDRAQVDGVGCRERGLVAQRITPRP